MRTLLKPPISPPPNTLNPAKVAAYCNQFMNPVQNIKGHYLAPYPGSSPYIMCVKYGFNLPSTGGGVGNTIGHIGGGGLAVLGVALLIVFLVRKNIRNSKKARRAPAR
jgi:hypothetical protein